MNKIISLLGAFSLVSGLAHASISENVIFSGDIRAKYCSSQYKTSDYSASVDGVKLEVRGKADYNENDVWASTELKFTTAISDHDQKTTLDLEKALIGYNFNKDLSIFVGRVSFDDVFNSKIQYGSKFNGISLNGTCENIPFIRKASLHGGPFIVSEGEDRCAFVGEVNLLADSLPLSLGYSLTCWNHQKSTGDMVDKYLISQVSASYSLTEVIASQSMGFFTGFLKNHGCDQSDTGWYVGSKLGKEKPSNAKEWNISLTYQDVKDRAIPQHDLNGAGKKMAARGFILESVYAVNDHLSFKGKAESSTVDSTDAKIKALEITAVCKF